MFKPPIHSISVSREEAFSTWKAEMEKYPQTGLWPVIMSSEYKHFDAKWSEEDLDYVNTEAEKFDFESWIKKGLADQEEFEEEEQEAERGKLRFEPRDDAPGPAIESSEVLSRVSEYSAQTTFSISFFEIASPPEVFTKVSFGACNMNPDNGVHMAIARIWFERYGAVPMLFSNETLEYWLPNPIADIEESRQLTIQHYFYCYDILQGRYPELPDYCQHLRRTKIWNFWWD